MHNPVSVWITVVCQKLFKLIQTPAGFVTILFQIEKSLVVHRFNIKDIRKRDLVLLLLPESFDTPLMQLYKPDNLIDPLITLMTADDDVFFLFFPNGPDPYVHVKSIILLW